MAAKDLITRARAKQSIQSITDTSQDALIDVLVTAASDEVVKFCKRDFISKTYDELYNGNGDRRLLLREYPIQEVLWCRYRPITVLKVKNTDQNLNQRATVSVTSTALKLIRVASGVTTTDTSITFSTKPTIDDLVTAINALSGGWTGTRIGDATDYGKWPSADLYVAPIFGDGTLAQGALNARNTDAELKMHVLDLQGYQWDSRGWLLRAIPYTDPELMHPEDLVWPVGINNFRIKYIAGFTTIPEAVQEACAEIVATLYYRTLRDPSASTQHIIGSVGNSWREENWSGIPANISRLLMPFRRHTVSIGQS